MMNVCCAKVFALENVVLVVEFLCNVFLTEGLVEQANDFVAAAFVGQIQV